MSRVLDAVRDAFVALGQDPRLVAPAAALVVFDSVWRQAAGTLGLWGYPTALALAAGAAAAQSAYGALMEPELKRRLHVVLPMFLLPALGLGLLDLGVRDFELGRVEAGGLSDQLQSAVAAYFHLSMLVFGLCAAAAARSFDAVLGGAGLPRAWLEGWRDVAERPREFGLLAVLFWLGGSLCMMSLKWPIAPWLRALFLHTIAIGAARRL